MKLGSVEHKELFCRSFTQSYREYALSNLIAVFGNDDPSKTGFAATGTDIFTKNLTIEKFLNICLVENQRRMSKYDPRLLQPQLLPKLASIALRILELIPKRKLETVERASA